MMGANYVTVRAFRFLRQPSRPKPARPRLRGIMSNLTDRIGDVKPGRFYVLRFCFGGGRDILVCLMSDARRFPPP